MEAIINSQCLPDIFCVGTYDFDNFSINDACARDGVAKDADIDAKGFFRAVVDAVADTIEKKLPGFRCLRDTAHMPNCYNYSTDSVDWKIEIPENYNGLPDAYILERVKESGLTIDDIYENGPCVLDFVK